MSLTSAWHCLVEGLWNELAVARTDRGTRGPAHRNVRSGLQRRLGE